MSIGETMQQRAEQFAQRYGAVRDQLARVIVGHDEIIHGVLTCMFVGGHCLLEGVPGLGKTLLVRTLADTLDLNFSRIQFTPDLMPADILGSEVLETGTDGSRAFKFIHGPIFCQLLMADEINRASPRTQSALLQAMQEKAVTVAGETRQRYEDAIIAYSWDKFLRGGDEKWPLRLPMTKAAVRALDTVTDFMASAKGGAIKVDRFVITGASKRGWTTWLTGAVDKRVVGIVPIVIDVLNVKEFNSHHFGAYGFWAPSIGNYVEHGITERADHPRMQSLYELVDPYYYRHRLTMPKYIVNASGDQFFLPDSSQFYFDELRGQKNLRYVPNADHGLGGTDAIQAITAFYSLVLEGRATPTFSWKHERDGFLRVNVDEKPTEVKFWQATNPNARDFRVETLGRKYTSEVLELDTNGEYTASISEPKSGWTAYFVELTYDTGGPFPLKLTTNVKVIPDLLPFKDKDSQRPSTITMQAVAPNQEAVEKLAAEAA